MQPNTKPLPFKATSGQNYEEQLSSTSHFYKQDFKQRCFELTTDLKKNFTWKTRRTEFIEENPPELKSLSKYL